MRQRKFLVIIFLLISVFVSVCFYSKRQGKSIRNEDWQCRYFDGKYWQGIEMHVHGSEIEVVRFIRDKNGLKRKSSKYRITNNKNFIDIHFNSGFIRYEKSPNSIKKIMSSGTNEDHFPEYCSDHRIEFRG